MFFLAHTLPLLSECKHTIAMFHICGECKSYKLQMHEMNSHTRMDSWMLLSTSMERTHVLMLNIRTRKLAVSLNDITTRLGTSTELPLSLFIQSRLSIVRSIFFFSGNEESIQWKLKCTTYFSTNFN